MEGRPCGTINLGKETLSGITKPSTTTATKLNRIAKLSNDDSDMEFKWLMPHFNKESLIGCFHALNGKKAVGIDGITKEKYGENLEENITILLRKMKTMSYQPQAVKEVLIPKEGKPGATRPLGISVFEDKIVQLQMAKILEAIYEPIFKDCSYGFRPNRSYHTAVKSLFNHLDSKGNEIVIDVDLKNFFGLIQHDILLDILRRKIKDEKFIRYVARMLKSGIFRDNRFEVSDEGSPQGNIASPILSNIYAHYALDIWMEDVVPKHTRQEVKSFRYADDQVICCRSRKDAEKIQRALKLRLRKFGLELNVEKTKVVEFNKWKFPNIKQGAFDYLGFTFYIRRSRKGYTQIAIKTSSKRFYSKLRKVKLWCCLNKDKQKLLPLWMKFNSKLRGHIQYYSVSLNSDYVHSFTYHAIGIFFKWINRRSQRKSMNWEQFNKFREAFPSPEIYIRHKLY